MLVAHSFVTELVVILSILNFNCQPIQSRPLLDGTSSRLESVKNLNFNEVNDLDQKLLLKNQLQNLTTQNGHRLQGARQDDDDDGPPRELPKIVPEIIKIVGSALSGNATAVFDNSISLLPEKFSHSITGALNLLVSSINNGRPQTTRRPRKTTTTTTTTTEDPEVVAARHSTTSTSTTEAEEDYETEAATIESDLTSSQTPPAQKSVNRTSVLNLATPLHPTAYDQKPSLLSWLALTSGAQQQPEASALLIGNSQPTRIIPGGGAGGATSFGGSGGGGGGYPNLQSAGWFGGNFDQFDDHKSQSNSATAKGHSGLAAASNGGHFVSSIEASIAKLNREKFAPKTRSNSKAPGNKILNPARPPVVGHFVGGFSNFQNRIQNYPPALAPAPASAAATSSQIPNFGANLKGPSLGNKLVALLQSGQGTRMTATLSELPGQISNKNVLGGPCVDGIGSSCLLLEGITASTVNSKAEVTQSTTLLVTGSTTEEEEEEEEEEDNDD